MTVGITELPPEGMQLGGVALAGDAERGTKTTEGLSLLFTTAGITVQGPQPQIERLLVWSGLDSASCREKVVLPDGRNAAVMELTSGGQSIRFLFPTESVTPGQAAYLDQALPHWLARYKGASPAPAAGSGNGSLPPPPPTTADQPAHVAPAAAAAAGAVAGAAIAGAPPAAAGTPYPPTQAPGAPPAPPSPPPPAYAAAPTFTTPGTGTPPPPPPPAAGAAWAASPDPLADTSAWSGPPTGQGADAASAPPAQKSSRWRKNKTPEAAAAPVSYQAPVDAAQAPFAPPNDPVRLDQTTLPPPPPDALAYPAGAASVWSPPVDPATGQALWDGQPGSAVAPTPELAPPTKGRAKRKADKAAKAAAVASVATVGAVGAEAAMSGAPAAPLPATAPFDPAVANPPPGEPGGAPGVTAPEGKPQGRNNRLLALMVVALVIVVAAIGYFVVKRHDNSTTTATTALVPVTTADTALAAAVNLHQNDLPSGWTASTAAGQPVRPPVAPAAAQAQATRTLAQCLGSTPSTISGLFAGTVLPGQTGAATSPSFRSPTDPTIAMHSVTRVMGSDAEAQALATPFTNANFQACYTAYQSSVVSAAVPGATAAVQTVPLTAPTGVQSFGYLTTLTIPNQGTEVIGQAFIVGGRIESTLEPTTGGAPVPTDAFTPAYNAIAGRVGLDASK